MNALHIDVAQLSPEQIVAMAQAGLLSVGSANTQQAPAHDVATVDEHTAESVLPDAPLNHRMQPCADSTMPHTWTHERLSNTAGRGTGRTDTLDAIARAIPNGFNPVVVSEGREIKVDEADHPVYHAFKGKKGRDTLQAAIEWVLANGDNLPASQPEPVKPVATVLPSSNDAKLAKLQADKRDVLEEIDRIKEMLERYPNMRKIVASTLADLTDQGDSIQADIDDLTKESDTRSPYAKIVGITPQVGKKVTQKATIAALGRVNPRAFDEQAEFVLRRPSVLQERYENAVKHAATLRKMIAERDAYRAIAPDKDTRKAINEKFAEQLDALQEKIGYFSRAIEPTSIDRYQCYIWLKDGKILANAVHGTMPDKDALERKALELNVEPGKKQKSNNAKKAAKTRKANKRNKK